ncbi:MAG: AI-2E family transporter [Rhodospirillales bacterium]
MAKLIGSDEPELVTIAAPEPQNLTQDELMRVVHASMPACVVGLAVLALLYTMYFAADLILPVFLAQFLSIILRPMVRGMNHFCIPRTIGALIVLIGLVSAIISGLINLSGPAEQWIHRIPVIQRDIEAKLWPVTESIKQAKIATANIEKIAQEATTQVKKSEVTIKKPSFLSRAFESTLLTSVQLLIVLALTFFFLTQNNEQSKRPFPKLPWLKHSDLIAEMFAVVQATITRFLQISAGIYFILGAITAFSMYLLEMRNPVLWGVLAAVLGFVPYVGPMIVFVCIGTVSLLTFDVWWQCLALPLTYGVLSIVEGNLITPSILGRKLKLNPIAVFLSMLLWTWVWGIAGAILAVPILVILVIVARHIALIIRERDIVADDVPYTNSQKV